MIKSYYINHKAYQTIMAGTKVKDQFKELISPFLRFKMENTIKPKVL